jgi:very-short-patch-repair endonuclease
MIEYIKKKKEISIKIQIDDISDIQSTMTMLSNQLLNGSQYNEFKNQSSLVTYSMEYIDKSDYKEIEIDGVWHQVIKSSM